MITHYYTLLALGEEFLDVLGGRRVAEIFTQQKNELWMTFGERDNNNGEHDLPSVGFSVNPKFNFCFLRFDTARARKNSTDLFTTLIGAVLDRVAPSSYDRALLMHFDNGLTLRAQMYDTSESNLLLLDTGNRIAAAFKNDKTLRGTSYQAKTRIFNEHCLTDGGQLVESLLSNPSTSIAAALKRSIPILGPVFTREILHRARVDEKLSVATLTPEAFSTIFHSLSDVLGEASAPAPRLYFRTTEAIIFSLIPLSHLADCRIETYATVNEAVRAYVSNIFRSHTIEGEKKELLGKLKKEDDRLHRSIELMTAELGNGGRAEQHERTGKILLANIYQLKRGTSEVDLPDPLAQDTSAHISLDPALSPAQNAEQYFEKAKRAKTARVETERRRHQMIVKSSFIKEIIVQLESCTTAAELKKFKKSYTKELKTMNLTPQQSPEERPPFRMFTVSGGFEVWVGKSSRNNDLLTMKFAKPNDLWFHVRGAGGSHTVLKVTGSADPSKKAILEAASIAAYYSKMRKAGSVPVAYCERKYVRKPRGLKEGAVTLEREKVVFVKPGLPNIEII